MSDPPPFKGGQGRSVSDLLGPLLFVAHHPVSWFVVGAAGLLAAVLTCSQGVPR